jgi:hypothetical protein
MTKLIAITAAFAVMCGPAFAQMTGAPAAAQTDPAKPRMGNPDQSAVKKSNTTTGMKKNGTSKKMKSKEDVTKNSMSK